MMNLAGKTAIVTAGIGLVPDFLLGRLALLIGLGGCVKNYGGRKGNAHSWSEPGSEIGEPGVPAGLEAAD